VLSIQSDPSGAVARLSNGRTCVTPCSLELSRKQSLTIVCEKEGYRTSTAYVRPGVRGGGSAGVAGNVLLGGVIGIATDVASGANKDLIPNPVTVNLEKDED